MDPEQQAIADQLENENKRRQTAESRLENVGEYMCESVTDLEVIKALGKGTFGSVYLARHKRSGVLIALKCLDKAVLVKASQSLYIKRECACLNSLCHPFISMYYDVLVTPRKVLFCLEYVPGGELWSYLYESDHARGPFGGISVTSATIYTASIVLALEHIHGLGYCYRDIKPENMLLDAKGYLKVVDFGFAKSVR